MVRRVPPGCYKRHMSKQISSMTGFARSEGLIGALGYVFELRSVNGRGLDLRLRLPPGFDTLEPFIREKAAAVLKRGNVTINLALKRDESPRIALDEVALEQALQLALRLATRIPGCSPPRAEALLALPGVMREGTEEASEAINEQRQIVLRGAFSQALEQLLAGRAAEGARTVAMLATQLDEIAALREQAILLAAAQPTQQRARMLEQLQALMREIPALPEERIAQEVALLASRSDVREELDRLGAHIEAARALLAEGGAIGRRFDFLTQEFVRETNTLCSKSATVPLTKVGLLLKSVIEQMREQVQNIE